MRARLFVCRVKALHNMSVRLLLGLKFYRYKRKKYAMRFFNKPNNADAVKIISLKKFAWLL